jgi:hypothetical protein
MSKPFFTIAVAYLILGLLTESVNWAVSNIAPSNLVSSLPSFLCVIPFVTRTLLCTMKASKIKVGDELDSILKTENQLDMLIEVAYADSLPTEIVHTRLSAVALGRAIEDYSEPPSKD